MRKLRMLFVITLVCLQACQGRMVLAPVGEGYAKNKPYYTVRKGDTLFSIAWRYDKNYRELAYYNHLSENQPLRIGQKLRLVSRIQKMPKRQRIPERLPVTRTGKWLWPTEGRVIKIFSPKKNQKGIDIAGKRSASVYASRSGVVAYSGDGLRGYGNLIILNHGDEYLSAYAHNKKNWVKEGQKIKAHQKIAEMGSSGRHRGVLHFEIRHSGKPLDPLKLLPRR